MRVVVIAMLLALAACGDSGSNRAPQVVATSSTTAEEARAIDGPVMRYQETSATTGGLSTLLDGVLQMEGNCLYLVQSARDQRFPILWPAETQWDAANNSVVTPAGAVMKIGAPVEGRGGYFFLSDIDLLAGTAAANLAAQCLDGDQIAVIQNKADAIAPTPAG